MPRSSQKGVRRRRGVKRYGRRRGARGGYGQRRAGSTDFASCVDTLGVIDVSANTPYALQNIALTNSARAKTIAQGFQFYRISKVEVIWKPVVDTFSGTMSVPTLYYMVDKSNTFPSNTDLASIKQAGAKPHTLNELMYKMSFRPAVQITSSDSPAGAAPVTETAGVVKTSPWITTNANAGTFGSGGLWAPNSVDHRGLVFAVEQRISGATQVATAEVRIHYQFKKAIWFPTATDSTVNVIDLDTMTVSVPQSDANKSA